METDELKATRGTVAKTFVDRQINVERLLIGQIGRSSPVIKAAYIVRRLLVEENTFFNFNYKIVHIFKATLNNLKF